MKRNTTLIVVIAVAGFFLLFNPLKCITGDRGSVPRPPVESATVQSLLGWAEGAWMSPVDYVVGSFASHRVVFLGELPKTTVGPTLVAALMQPLYDAGVRDIAVEYARVDDQARIDALVTSPAWGAAQDEEAKAVTRDWVITWAYREYVDLFKAAWTVNSRRAAGADPLRVLALSPRQDWTAVKDERDAADPAALAKLYAAGVPDAVMADVIRREVVDRGRRALVFCSYQHAFTRYRSLEYEKKAAEVKLPETRRAGNILFASLPAGTTFTIAVHAPWPQEGTQSGFGYPAGGAVDALLDVLPRNRQAGGWDLAGTPVGALSIAGSVYATGAATRLSDLFDGYVTMGPLRSYVVVTEIPGFIRPADDARAVSGYPGPKPQDLTADRVRSSITQELTWFQKAFVQLQ